MKKPTKIAFTKRRLAALPLPEKGRIYVYDSGAAGLAVCLTATGKRTFYLYRWINGRPQRYRIGPWPDVGIEQARKEAARLGGQIAHGVNPQDQRRAAREEMTLGELHSLYMETYAKAGDPPKKRSWRQDDANFRRYLKPWASRKLSAISRLDVERLHNRVGERHGHYAANRMLALFRAEFNRCVPDVPNPAKGVKAFPEESRERFLGPDDLTAFFKALDGEPNTLWRDFFWLLLLTGARRANVQSMAWADLDLDRGLWRVSGAESKNRKPMMLVLSVEAVEILRRREAEKNGNPYVFPSVGKTGHITEPKKAWRAILDRAGIEGVRMHDLRRTLGSWQALTGASLPIIGKALGHKPGSTATAGYARLNDTPVRESIETATDAMLKYRAPLALPPAGA